VIAFATATPTPTPTATVTATASATATATVIAIAIAGCSMMRIPTTSRDRRLATGNAPAPTVLSSTLRCTRDDYRSDPAARLGGDQVADTASRMDAILRRRGDLAFALDPSTCAMAADLRSDVAQRWHDWRAPKEAMEAMERTGAQSVLVSFASGIVDCETGGRRPRRCWDALVSAGAILFDREGAALWRGQAVIIHEEHPPSDGFDRRSVDDIYEDVPIAPARAR
jgi:hypothetical protein